MTTQQTIQASLESMRALPEDCTVDRSAWVQIEADGQVTLETQHKNENSTSFYLYHGRAQTLPLPSGVQPSAVAGWLEEAAQLTLLAQVVDGLDSDWNGNNTVGTLTDEAQAALETLERAVGLYGDTTPFEGEIISSWDAADWLSDMNDDLAAAPTAEAAEELASEAVNHGEVMDDPNSEGRMQIDDDDARRYARAAWTAGRE